MKEDEMGKGCGSHERKVHIKFWKESLIEKEY
jgi:hypothetical protein